MQDRVPLYPGRVKMTPVAGQANTYDMVRADDPTQAGTPLNKATLLKDATAALFGKTNAAVPDDILSLLSKSVLAQTVGEDTILTDVLGTKLTVGGQIKIGSYVGTGTYGQANPNTLTFSFVPYMVVILCNNAATYYPGTVFIKGQTLSDGIGHNEYTNGAYALSVSWVDKTVSWYSTSTPGKQLNFEGDSYYYFAIGR